MIKYLTLATIALMTIPVSAQKVIFAPQWSAQAQFAGYYVAESKGFYAAEGLDVEIVHPSQAENSYALLKSGKAQFIDLNLSQALHYFSQGADLVNIMQVSQVNSLLLVGHSPLPNIAALENCKLGVFNYVNPKLVRLILSKYGINAELVRFNNGVNVFLSKAVDVSLMVSFNEFIQLTECGYRIDSAHVMFLSDWGYDMPEGGVYVQRSFYEKNRETVSKFVEASKKGWEYAAAHQTEALKIIMNKTKECRIATNEYHQQQMLREIFRLQKNPETGTTSYRLSKKSFNSAINFMSLETLKYEDFVKQ